MSLEEQMATRAETLESRAVSTRSDRPDTFAEVNSFARQRGDEIVKAMILQLKVNLLVLVGPRFVCTPLIVPIALRRRHLLLVHFLLINHSIHSCLYSSSSSSTSTKPTSASEAASGLKAAISTGSLNLQSCA